MQWLPLTDISQLHVLIKNSNEQSAQGLTVLIFKHSTRCSISSMALNRLESKWQNNENVKTYFLDLLKFRDVSNEIARVFNVEHQSPQVLIIKNGKCVYHNSHNGISYHEIEQVLTKQSLSLA